MYHFSQVVKTSFAGAIEQVTASLQEEGFGILTEIDVQAAFKKKLGQEFRQYKILGACHPGIAYRMIQADDKAGTLYPCNVVVQEHEDGRVEVSAVDPLMMFLMVHAPEAKAIALEASKKMQAVIARLPAAAIPAIA
ncbi:MAG: DUF302 domain-containing protein [Leptolyngbyaceae cyanobacterium SM1_1_3]|nr:DUF302 domain-containing protein [Leptolyngbyaceae cyanobacterium SM1_1_3]NJN01676.1 DUF302 domain-containing protein [Leptolyngbyaceae cyanobacterium RM1_1_2]NJO11821.1 DUF302 domain-containing protein [Leptolyngbyaceae cyanobacterium SL_1_1]